MNAIKEEKRYIKCFMKFMINMAIIVTIKRVYTLMIIMIHKLIDYSYH